MKKRPTIEEVDALIARNHAGEFRKFSEDEICKIFGVDPGKVRPFVEVRRQQMAEVERDERDFIEGVRRWLGRITGWIP